MSYKCSKHMSNEGFYDADGNWRCWYCEKEDKYKYPDGKMFDRAKLKDYEIRVLVKEEKSYVEVWKLSGSPPEMILKRAFKYMSRAVRFFNELIDEIRRYGKLSL